MRLHGSHCFFRFNHAGHRIKRFHARRGFESVICFRDNLSQNKGSSLFLFSGLKRVVLSFIELLQSRSDE